VLKTVYRSSCRDKHNCQRRDSNLDPLTPQSDALTTRPLRPAPYHTITIPSLDTASIHHESVRIQLAQCWFPGLAISDAKILIYFSDKIYGSDFIKQHSETVMVWNYRHADCSLREKFYCCVWFIIIFGTLSFLTVAATYRPAVQTPDASFVVNYDDRQSESLYLSLSLQEIPTIRTIIRPHRMHRITIRPIATDRVACSVYLSVRLSVCLSVCWSGPWAVQNSRIFAPLIYQSTYHY